MHKCAKCSFMLRCWNPSVKTAITSQLLLLCSIMMILTSRCRQYTQFHQHHELPASDHHELAYQRLQGGCRTAALTFNIIEAEPQVFSAGLILPAPAACSDMKFIVDACQSLKHSKGAHEHAGCAYSTTIAQAKVIVYCR